MMRMIVAKRMQLRVVSFFRGASAPLFYVQSLADRVTLPKPEIFARNNLVFIINYTMGSNRQ